MKYPDFIKENSCIGVPAPSAGASDQGKKNRFINAKKKLEELEYKIILSDNIYNCVTGRSASAKVRAEEFNNMIEDKSIDFVLCATGGGFLVEILPYINFDLFKSNMKFVAGFSDPTGLLYPITTKYDIATIYGQNFSSFGAEKWHRSEEDFIKIINGNLITQCNYDLYEGGYQERITGLESYNLTDKVYWRTLNEKSVNLKGRIIGGCLDVIAELAGTKYDGVKEFNERYKNDGIIWYFDNCELSKEETIRLLWKLKELGYFDYCKGVVFGRFGTDVTTFGYTVKTCLQDSVLNELNIPIIYDADISHKGPCLTIINGAIAMIDVEDGKGNISFELK